MKGKVVRTTEELGPGSSPCLEEVMFIMYRVPHGGGLFLYAFEESKHSKVPLPLFFAVTEKLTAGLASSGEINTHW